MSSVKAIHVVGYYVDSFSSGSMRHWKKTAAETSAETVPYYDGTALEAGTVCWTGRGQDITFGGGLEPQSWRARERDPI